MMGTKTNIIILIVMLIGLSARAQHGNSKVHWISMEEAQELSKENPKPILVDFYTSWCGWCKKMMSTTFSDPQVSSYINQNFYAVSFNAETGDTLVFKDKQYVNRFKGQRSRPPHDFALELKIRSYPTTVFYQPDFEQPMIVPGYLDQKSIAPFLVFLQEQVYKGTNINDFRTDFSATFEPKPSLEDKNAKAIKWYGLQEAIELNDKNPKKLFVQMYSQDCASCKVMDSTTYKKPEIVEILNNDYYAVKFDVASTDTITIQGNTLTKQGPLHQFALATTNNKPSIPTALVFNGQNQMIAPVASYVREDFGEAILSYFRDDKHTNTDWQKYYGEFMASKAPQEDLSSGTPK